MMFAPLSFQHYKLLHNLESKFFQTQKKLNLIKSYDICYKDFQPQLVKKKISRFLLNRKISNHL